MRDLTRYFKALTSVSRLRIMQQLASTPGEVSVGELALCLEMSQPLVSWHLRDLKRVNLVQMRRTGRQALCSLNRGRLKQYQALFAQLIKEQL